MNPEKQHLNIRRLMFLVLSITFSGISLYNQYGFLSAFYGADIGLMISSSIEIGSVSLFFFVLYTVWRWVSHLPIVVLIVFLRLCCGLVNFTAFSYDVQRVHFGNVQETYRCTMEVLPEYEKIVQEMYSTQLQDVVYNSIRAKKYSNGGYIEANDARLRPYREEKANLEKIYRVTPGNIIEYLPEISRMSAKTGKKIETGNSASEGKETAIKSIFGISIETFNVIISGAFSFFIELMIVMSVLMGYFQKKSTGTEESTRECISNVQCDTGIEPGISQGAPEKNNTSVPRDSTLRAWLDYRTEHGQWKPVSEINYRSRAYYKKFIAGEHPELKGENR